jgi:hypothetical protein
MRFLMFNLVVSGALVYLLMGEEYRTVVVEDMMNRASESVVSVVEDTVKMIETGASADGPARISGAIPAEPEVMSQAREPAAFTPRQDEPAAFEAGEFKAGSPALPGAIDREPAPLFSEWSVAQPLPRIDDPSVIQRRAEVLGLGSIIEDGPQPDAPTFMTAQERQKELHTLAEEMELLFATTVVR